MTDGWSLNKVKKYGYRMPSGSTINRDIGAYVNEPDLEILRQKLIEDINHGLFSDNLYEFDEIIKHLNRRFGVE